MDRKFTLATFSFIAVWFAALDRLTKLWAAENLQVPSASLELGPIRLTLVHNEGAAFGLGQGQTWLFAGLAVVILLVIVGWLIFGHGQRLLDVIALGLVAAGGIGNLIDRLTTGYVVDFIQFTFIGFPVFNIADICVTVGVALVIVSLFSRVRSEQQEIFKRLEEQSAAERERAKAEAAALTQAKADEARRAAAEAKRQASARLAAEIDELADEWDESDEEWERAEREKMDRDGL